MTSPTKTLTVTLGDGKPREIRVTAGKQKRLDEQYGGDYFATLAGTKWHDTVPMIAAALKEPLDEQTIAALSEEITRSEVDDAIDKICQAINGRPLKELIDLAIQIKNAQSGSLPGQ